MKSKATQRGLATMLEMTIEERLSASATCPHCQDQSRLKLSQQAEMTIGCYTCQSGYVSRIVNYGTELDIAKFQKFLSASASGIAEVTEMDVRVATRYTWDMGIENRPSSIVLREAYWTQNYGRSKNNAPNRKALFLCTNCESFYSQPFQSMNGLCSQCRETK